MTIHELTARLSLPASAGRTALPPGFRFHPTDQELILHYLRRRVAAAPCPAPIIAEVDIYKLNPWELPAKAVFGQPDGNEWYFFSPRERKYPNGVRPNRAAGSGYWKATGTDKPITGGAGEMIGVKKALVFYQGRPPKGLKTSWIMHEYRLAAAGGNTYRPPTMSSSFKVDASMRLDDWVLCRIYKKPDHQLMYESSSSSSMDVGLAGAIAQQHQQQQEQDLVATYDGEPSRSRMPRPPSISDYLEDYSAVSALFDSMPPEDSEAVTSAQSTAAVDDDVSKRWLSDASITMPTMNSTFSMFGPSHSHQDRI